MLVAHEGRLYKEIKQVIEKGRDTAYRAVNATMVEVYWQIGKLIVEDEQGGKHKADYGTALLDELSLALTKEYGKSYSSRNLRYLRQFYSVFPKWNAVRSELSWTHYRLLLKAEREDTRLFYMQETIDGNWSTRTLERQMNSLYIFASKYKTYLPTGQQLQEEIAKERAAIEMEKRLL